jgi:hypothetical protein
MRNSSDTHASPFAKLTVAFTDLHFEILRTNATLTCFQTADRGTGRHSGGTFWINRELLEYPDVNTLEYKYRIYSLKMDHRIRNM